MDIEKILADYDAMFGKCDLAEIENYLVQKMNEAKDAKESGILFTLLNEIIGFCRDTTQKEKALLYCDELLTLLKALQLEGRVDYATALLNIANAYRAFGLFRESLELYEKVHQIYLEKIAKTDFRYASLYNNWSLVYQELGEHKAAKELLLKALAIVDTYREAAIPQATTRTNLATSLLQMGTEKDYEEAIGYLKEALSVFEKDEGRDFHYGAALVAMGDACVYKNEYQEAVTYYQAGLKEIDKHVGKTDNYRRVLEKYEYAKSRNKEAWEPNLKRSRAFYESYGRDMIHTCFPEYENRIAVGMVGEGSDCYGFDDEISEDHDYEPGFCMWLTEEDYEKIGESLQAKYDKLADHGGFLKKRRGAFPINQFYNEILGRPFERWQDAEEYRLAAATNGSVFRDDLGIFSEKRSQLRGYYPEHIWRRKLAKCIHEFSQYAQSNYPRMMARKDVVTANICAAKAVESAMDIVYLLGRTYAPYYKWKRKGLENMPLANSVLPLLEQVTKMPNQSDVWKDIRYDSAKVNLEDKCVQIFEKIAEEILSEMKRQDLVSGTETFLEYYIKQILKGKHMDIIEQIIKLEWKQFDKVKNEGGRASCQDDFETFSIMRKGQYLAWPEELLKSYCVDLQVAEEKGWNLIMEKICPHDGKHQSGKVPGIKEQSADSQRRKDYHSRGNR